MERAHHATASSCQTGNRAGVASFPSAAQGALPREEQFDLCLLDDARSLLGTWDATFGALLVRSEPTASTRTNLMDGRRIAAELASELRRPAQRWLCAVKRRGTVQCVGSLQAAPRALFVEYLVSAPWNLLRAGDPRDSRTVRGAASTLIEQAVRLSAAVGHHGRLVLEADNRYCRDVYFHFGFRAAPGETGELTPQQGSQCRAEDLMMLDPAASLGWRRRSDARLASRKVAAGRLLRPAARLEGLGAVT